MKGLLFLSAHRAAAALLAAFALFGYGLLAYQGLRDALVFELVAVLTACTLACALYRQRTTVWQDSSEEIEPAHLPDTGKLPVLDEEAEGARRTLVAEWPVYTH